MHAMISAGEGLGILPSTRYLLCWVARIVKGAPHCHSGRKGRFLWRRHRAEPDRPRPMKKPLLLVRDDREGPVVEAEMDQAVADTVLDGDRVAACGDAGLVPDDRVRVVRVR